MVSHLKIVLEEYTFENIKKAIEMEFQQPFPFNKPTYNPDKEISKYICPKKHKVIWIFLIIENQI